MDGYEYAPVVEVGRDIAAPQSYPDVYVRGNHFSVVPSKFAAGVDVSQSVPNGTFWDVKSVEATFTASAAVANRFIGFVVRDQDANIVYQYQMTAAVTAGLTGVFTFSEDCTVAPTSFATTNRLLMPQPKAWILPGWSFGTRTLNIDAGDQWSSVAIWVQEWLPPMGE